VPLCTVLLPEGYDYGWHGKVYANTRILWRTAQKLLSARDGKIVFPEVTQVDRISLLKTRGE
jgi:CRISPR-associated endonuclease/helicase Cas3